MINVPDKDLALNYSYDVITGNINYRSFQIESLYSRDRLHDCDNCPKPDYKKFVDYYGVVSCVVVIVPATVYVLIEFVSLSSMTTPTT